MPGEVRIVERPESEGSYVRAAAKGMEQVRSRLGHRDIS